MIFKQREPWFKIREELNAHRAGLLTALSFFLPLAIWCLVSYAPFIWHPDVRLDVSADRTGVATVYTAGDHVSKEFFATFQNAVRDENQQLLQDRQNGDASADIMVRRDNQKKLRQLAPLAISNGWLRWNQRDDDDAIYKIWKEIATGALTPKTPPLSPENLDSRPSELGDAFREQPGLRRPETARPTIAQSHPARQAIQSFLSPRPARRADDRMA